MTPPLYTIFTTFITIVRLFAYFSCVLLLYWQSYEHKKAKNGKRGAVILSDGGCHFGTPSYFITHIV